MKKLLITGFEPFGEHSINPSAVIAKISMEKSFKILRLLVELFQ